MSIKHLANARRINNRCSSWIAAALLVLASPIVASSTAHAAEAEGHAGVTDLTLARADMILASDISQALAPTRGTRIERSTRPSVLLPVLFEFDSATLRPEAKALLSEVHKSITSSGLRGFNLLLEGHTDDVGLASYNQALSARRAATVKRFLVSRGVAPDRLVTAGVGEARPVAPNYSEDGRSRNRRVVIVNLGRSS